MADRIKGITIEIGGDTTGLSKALSGVNKEIRNTQSQLKDVERLLKLDPSNIELLSQKQKLLSQAVGDTKNKIDTLKNSEQQAQQQFAEGKISEQQYDALKREIIETSEQLKSLEKQAANANVTLQQIGIAGDKFKEVGDKISGAGEKMLPATAAVAGIGVAAIKVTADFDEAMSKVAAISGATGDEFDKLRDKAREMGEKTKFSASEAADAFQYMAMAGWKTEDMLDGIEGIMNLAAASGEELALTSDIVTDALTAFGLTAKDSAHFADILAAASSNSNTNVSMMGETFKYVAPLAGSLKYSAEDTAVAIGLMANSGIKASQAGTQLRAAITNMVKPTDSMIGVMDELGIEITNDDGSMKSLKETTEMLRSAFAVSTPEIRDQRLALYEQQMEADGLGSTLKGLTEEQKYFTTAMYAGTEKIKDMSEAEYKKLVQDNLGINIKKQKLTEQQKQNIALMVGTKAIDGLTEAEQAEAAATLFGKEAMSGMLAIINASESDYKKLTKAVDECDGSTQKMADTMQDNLKGQLTILKSQLEELAISIGDTLMPKIRELVKRVQGLVDWFNNLSTSQKETVVKVGLVVAAIGPLLIIIGKVSTGIGALMKVISTLGTMLSLLSAAGGPILLTVAAVAALSLILIKVKGSTKNYRAEAEALNEQEIKNKETVDDLYSSYQQMDEQRRNATESAQAEAQHESDLFKELQSITDENGNVIAGYESRAEFITGELSKALGIEIGMTDNQIQNYKDMAGEIDNLIRKKQANALLDASQQGYAEAIKNQTDAFMAYKQAQADVEDTTKKLTEAQKELRKEAEAINDNPFYDMRKFEAAKETVNGYSTKLGELKQTLSDAENAYIGYNTTISNYEGLSSAIISGDQQAIEDAITRTANQFQTAETATKESLERQVQTYTEKYAEMKKAVDEGAPGITQAQVDQMKQLVEKSELELNRLPGIVSEAVSKSAESAKEATKVGNDFAAGVAQGILAGKGNVISMAAGIAAASVEATRTELDSHSPSRVMDSIGQDFDSGFANGISAGKGGVISNVISIIDAIKTQLTSLPGQAVQWGADMIDGLVDGIKSKVGAVTKAIKGVAENITSYIHFSRPDVGPLREYEKWMPDMVSGLAKGIKDNAWKITDQLKGLTGNMSYMLNGDASGAGSTDLTKIEGLLGYYLPGMSGGTNIVLDDGALVGKMLPNINSGLTNFKDTNGRNG
ncbi:phage tail tape measure protein, TP901 family [Clostridium sp. ASBs410]|nr:phage tail tape measure protein, TP901 family [Clostridium sp. ASBs410]